MAHQHMMDFVPTDEPWAEAPPGEVTGGARTVIVDGAAMSYRSYRRRQGPGGG